MEMAVKCDLPLNAIILFIKYSKVFQGIAIQACKECGLLVR